MRLEFQQCKYIGDVPEHPSYEIALYYKNPFKDMLDEYIKQGDLYIYKKYPEVKIDKATFEAEEFNCAIILFKWDKEHYKVEFVDDKPCILLDTKDWIRLQDMITLHYHNLNTPLNPKDEEDLNA